MAGRALSNATTLAQIDKHTAELGLRERRAQAHATRARSSNGFFCLHNDAKVRRATSTAAKMQVTLVLHVFVAGRFSQRPPTETKDVSRQKQFFPGTNCQQQRMLGIAKKH